MTRHPAILLAAACLATTPVHAAEGPTGPAAAAVRQWFAADLSLGCVDQDGKVLSCSQKNGPTTGVFYGNADGGPGTPDAMALITYLADPTGNAQQTVAAAFRQDGTGQYRFIRRLNGASGTGVVPGTPVRFSGGKVMLTIQAMRPGDSRCCPTGRKQVSLDLR